MPGQLECPMSGTNIDADLLYYSRGEDNSSYRPVLTGDVYENLLLPGSTGTERNRTVIILQHPCSMRANGVDLVWHILAAEVTKHKPLGLNLTSATNIFLKAVVREKGLPFDLRSGNGVETKRTEQLDK